MVRKRLFSAGLVLVMLLCLAGTAFAEEESAQGIEPSYPILPEGHPEDHMPPIPEPRRGGLTLTISGPSGELDTSSTDWFSGATTWTLTASGGTGSYSFLAYLLELDSDLGSHNVVSYMQTDSYSTETTAELSYQLLVSGNYMITAWVDDSNGASRYQELYFSVFDDQHPTVYEVVSNLIAQCRADGNTTDYEIALWCHDYLTEHANYDYTYSHYHADGVLVGGTGVCDSYSKAFLFMMREAGIPVCRVTNSGHSWNELEVQGEWYYVDATWDDPNQGGGLENHVYFCIPDEILGVDHKNYEADYPCTSYDWNYYIQEGTRAAGWATAMGNRIQTGLQAGDDRFNASYAQGYIFEKNVYVSKATKAGKALGDKLSLMLALQKTYTYGNESVPVPLTGEKSEEDSTVAAIQVDGTGRTISLPGDLTVIGAGAFEGVVAPLAVTVPDGATSIAADAFRDCDSLWTVEIPTSVTVIGENAFDSDNPHLTIVADENSTANDYADANGMKTRTVS